MEAHDFGDDDALQAFAAPSANEPEPDACEDGPLAVATRVEYSALPKGKSRSVFGLVTVKAAAVSSAPSAERQAMDLVCVLDVSGSMDGPKIEELKNAVRFIINEAGPQDRLSIVAFQSVAVRKLHLALMDEHGKEQATLETIRLSADGGTSIADGVHMGLEVMEQRRHRNKVSAILLLTDGQDSSAKLALPGLLGRTAKIGCSLYAFGFGADHDSTMLREISEQARTPYTFIESEDAVRAAFAGVVGGLSSIVAQGVELWIQCRVSLGPVHTPFEVRRQTPGPTSNGIVETRTVTIPDMFAGERRDVLLELLVPATLEGNSAVLLDAYACYRDLTSGDRPVRTPPAVLEVTLQPDEQQPEMEPDQEVADQRDRIEVAQVLEQAAGSSDAGNFDAAQQQLEQQLGKVKQRSSPVCTALAEELEDARLRMQNQLQWQQAGRAEVQDAMQMHRMQRCTNTSASKTANSSKSTKEMYRSSVQERWISKATGASSTHP